MQPRVVGYAHPMEHRRKLLVGIAAVAALGLVGCGNDDDDTADSIIEDVESAARTAVSEAGQAVDEAGADAAEAVVRNLAAQQGAQQFADAGSPLDDDGLTCEATASDGLDSVDVNCTGTTEDGGEAALTGTTDELPGESITEVEGTFTGTVDGSEVFTTDTLGG
jgi:uncharacterized lipoprotein NlpE involved in copper resistance